MKEERRPVILVVDDKDAGRYVTARMIRAAGFSVIEAATGAAALNMARLKPDIIILDINLPDIDGFEVCRRLKSDPETKSIFVLHLTAAYMSVKDKVAGLEGGADGYMTLPVGQSELIATINAFMRLSHAERKIEENALQWQTTFDSINDGISLLDAEGRILRSNRVFKEIFRKCDDELSGLQYSGLLVPAPDAARIAACTESTVRVGSVESADGLENVTTLLERSARTLKRETIEVLYRAAWYLVALDPIMDAAGKLAGFVNVMSDTTERRRALDEIRQQEAMLRKVLETLPVGVRIIDGNGTPVLGNQAEQQVWEGAAHTGIPQSGEYRGWGMGTGTLIQAKEWASVRAVTQGETSINEEVRIQCRDGSFKTILNSAAPILDKAGKITGAVAVHQDITDRKNAEEALKTLNTELEERVRDRTARLETANKELEAFSFSVSHDLRSPLHVMNGFAAALGAEYGYILDEQGQHYLERITESSVRMERLITDLLGLSRVSRPVLTLKRVDLSSLSEKIAAELRAEQPDRKVHFGIAPDLVATGDPNLLAIMMENLIGNAWKYSGKKESAHIQVGARKKPGGETVFFVRDDGIGFDMCNAGMLFKPFQRLHREEEYPGTGIGLVTIQRIVTRHGGRVWPEAEPGIGATFFFTLNAGAA